MAIWGIDYSQGYDLANMTRSNVKFACRYIGYTSPGLPQTKILTLDEAKALSNAGINIVSNWEWYNMRPSEGYNAGVWDAQQAAQLHKAVGGPSNRPIYFSVDYDTDGRDTASYFQGAASVIGLARVGAYGPYAAIKFLFEAGLIKWCWQTYAWSNGLLYGYNNIYQYNNGVNMGDMVVDYDWAYTGDYGQWRIGANTVFHPDNYNAWIIQRWEQFFRATNQAGNIPPRETGIFNTWRGLLLNRNIDIGSPLSAEIDFDATWIVQYFEGGEIWHNKLDSSEHIMTAAGPLQ